MGRVIVLGLDGASWEIIDFMIEKGSMPHFKELKKDSFSATLKSTIPPVTAPSWVTISTGVNPAKHGCFDFNKTQNSLSKLRTIQSFDIKVKTLYEILRENEKKSILINLPVTYPPLTDNITITSLLTKGDNAIFPEELKEKNEIFKKYRIFPDTSLIRKGDILGYIRDIIEVERIRFEVIKFLFDYDFSLFFVVLSGGDFVSHLLYPSILINRAPELVKDIFSLFDEVIAFFLKSMQKDDTFIILSDHGFKKAKGTFFLNQFLFEKGFLTPDYGNPVPPISHKMEQPLFSESDYKKVNPAIIKLGMGSKVIGDLIKVLKKFGFKYPLFLRYDSSQSKAVMPTSETYGVVINLKDKYEDGLVRIEEKDSLIEEIKSLLEKIDDGEDFVFKGICKKEELYKGKYLDCAPDLIFKDSSWGFSSALRTLHRSPFQIENKGIHSNDGIFLAFGKAIKKEKTEEMNFSVEDIAPTILFILDEKIPFHCDGRVLKEIFEEGCFKEKRIEFKDYEEPKRKEIVMEDEEVKKRLKSLGYMS